MLVPNDPGQRGRVGVRVGGTSWGLGRRLGGQGSVARAGTCPGEKDGPTQGRVSHLSAGHNQEGEVEVFQGS